MISFNELRERIEEKFADVGVPEEQAKLLGEYFSTVEFYGVASHGVKTIDAHIRKINQGTYNLHPSFRIKKETSAFAVIDGDNAIGMVSAMNCINYAMQGAKKSGIYTVMSPDNNTYGSAFYYALKAAEKGFICITSSNSPAQMAAFGGKEKILGTNPFSIAIPAKNNHPIVIDMATSSVAKSKINEYKEKNMPIPDGWALDKEGKPTTDAQKALEGLMLPMAGFKGYGISMMIDIISGVLSGASYLGNVGRFYTDKNESMNVGFTFTVISPEIVYGAEFYDEIDKYISTVRNSCNIEGEKILLPGDDRVKMFENNIKNGINVSL